MKELTEEELEEKRRKNRERVTRYRVKHGILSTGRGQVKRGEKVTSEIKNGVLVHTRERDEWRPQPQTHLTKDSKLEDLLPWAMEVAEELRCNPTPAAWASALNSVLKIIEYLDKKLPPTMPEVKPRPRKVIVLSDEKEETEE